MRRADLNMIARYRAKDVQGRQHLIGEYFDKRKGHWLELRDGTPVTESRDGTFASDRGQTFVTLTRD